MKRLNIQIQPTRHPELDVTAAIMRLTRLAADVRVTEGADEGRYVNIDFKADNVSALWASIQEELQSVAGLAGAAIVVCEGDHGWDDYLLLHHFDPQELID